MALRRRMDPGDAVRMLAPRGGSPIEYVPVEEGLGRVLAEEIRTLGDEPRENTCILDGFLVKVQAGRPPLNLEIAEECLPGDVIDSVRPGSAVGARTGCQIKDDDVALIPLEEAVEREGSLTVSRPPSRMENIAPRGSSLKGGTPLLRAGRRLTPLDMELVHSLGRDYIPVYMKPIVGVLSVGSEITLDESSELKTTTRHLAVTLALKRMGCTPSNMGVVPDDIMEIARHVRDGVKRFSAVITVGGTGPSAGDVTIKSALSLRPAEAFIGLDVVDASKISGAVLDGKPVVMLPGPRQPAINGLVLVVAPLMGTLMGNVNVDRIVKARLAAPLTLTERNVLWFSLDEGSYPPVATHMIMDYHGISLRDVNGFVTGGPGTLEDVIMVHVPEYLV